MSCHTVRRKVVFSLGLSLSATSVFALPTEVGRTADVFTNATRYQVAARPTVYSPKLRPADLVTTVSAGTSAPEPEAEVAPVVAAVTVPFDPAEFAEVDGAFEVALEAIDLGPRWISSVTDDDLFGLPVAPIATASLDLPLQFKEDEAFGNPVEAIAVATLDIPMQFKEDGLHQASVAPVAVASLNIPTGYKEDEAFQVGLDPVDLRTLVIPRATFDDAFEVPLEPIALANLDVPPAVFEQVEDSDITQVAVSLPEAAAAVSSSRTEVDNFTDALNAALGTDVVAEEETDIMTQMVDTDENLVLRDGGEGGIDTMMMSSDVLFSFGSADLADDALETLASIGDLVDEVPVLQVFGHTDAIGSESNNLNLGQARAETVRAWLLENTEFTEDRIVATGVGEVDPVVPNVTEAGDDDPDGRAQNRRVEFAFHETAFTTE